MFEIPRASRRTQTPKTTLLMIRRIALSHGLDSALILAYAAIGVIPMRVPAAYAAIGWTGCAFFYGLAQRRTGEWHSRIDLTLIQVSFAIGVQLVFMACVPQLTFIFLSRSLILWIATSAAIAVTLPLQSRVDWLPMATRPERALLCLCLVATLGRCVVLGNFGRRLSERLTQRNKELRQALGHLRHRDDELASYSPVRSGVYPAGFLGSPRLGQEHDTGFAVSAT